MSRFDNPTFRLMALPIWPLLSTQHQCLSLLRDSRGLAADAVDSILRATLARHGNADEHLSRLYLGGPVEVGCLYFRNPLTGWRYRPWGSLP